MIKRTAIMIAILGILSAGMSVAKKQTYWVDEGVTVLVFLGNIHSLDFKPVKFTMYEKQKIRLFHKKSGPGIYAFHLPGTTIKGHQGKKITVEEDGYFLAKVKDIRKHEFKNKSSLKRKTKAPWWPWDQMK